MTSPRTPDASQQLPRPPQRGSGPQRSAAKPILIATAVVGGLALAAIGATAVVSALQATGGSGAAAGTQTADAAGVASVDIEVGGSAFELVFADVDEAVLEVTGNGRTRWQLHRTGDEISVGTTRNWCFFWCFGEDQRATLTLPDELDDGGLDVDLDLGAGDLRAAGDFRSLDVEVGAGSLSVEGSTRTLGLELSAGRAELDLADVAQADIAVSAGRVTGALTGTAPDRLDLDVSAGSIDLSLPDTPYRVVSDVSAGSFDNLLDTSSSSQHAVQVDVSAGSATLRPGS